MRSPTVSSPGTPSSAAPHAACRSPTGDHVVADFPGRGPRDRRRAAALPRAPRHGLAGRATRDAMPWREQDGVVHGPGVFDMKGGLVVLETALEQVAERLDHRPVRVVVVADEEIGSPSARDLVTAESAGVVRRLRTRTTAPERRAEDVAPGQQPGPDRGHRPGGACSSRPRERRLRDRRAGRPADRGTCRGRRVRRRVVQRRHHHRRRADERRTGVASADIGFRFVDPETERAVLDCA